MKRRGFLVTGVGLLAAACKSSVVDDRPDIAFDLTSFQTLNTDDASFRFLAIGDVGTGKTGQYQVARVMSAYWQAAPYPLVLMLGDNIYNTGRIKKISRVFEQPYKPLLDKNVKFRAILGNHDVHTNRGDDQVAYPGYNMPARYYAFTQGTVQFFALDTTQAYLRTKHRTKLWGEQLNWLEKELTQSTAPWKIVLGHHAIYSSGRHGSDPELARELQPLFSKYGVQLYLNGHDHHYERTASLNGTTYITSGNGAKLRKVGSSDWTAYASAQLGFTAFNVYKDRIHIMALGTEGNIFDEIEIMAIG